MCGIAGYRIGRPVEPKVLKDMVEVLYHRGPDAAGFYSDGKYQAGMRRLVINDLKTGDQPLFNQDKSVALLYNGEIYNSVSLRRQLEDKGYRFRTHCDGEVICHLYDEYGDKLFEKLDGMFAAALWVAKEKKLILARDIAGEKPLYFSLLSKGELVFASEIKSIKRFPGLKLELDKQAIWDFPTFLWVPEPATIYKSIQALLPGHMLIVSDNGAKMEKYANTFNRGSIDLGDESVIRETRRLVQNSVESRLLSDVPVGCFLSSGLDSSIVATLAARNLRTLATFTVSFQDLVDPYHGRADESAEAEDYAKKIGTRHYTIKVFADTFRELLDKFVDTCDQPFAVSSGLGLLAVARAAREAGVKVLLSGDGADENFGGYSWYEHLPLDGNSRQRYVEAGDVSFQNFGLGIEERLKLLSAYPARKRAWAWHYYASETEKKGLFSGVFAKNVQSSLRFFSDFNPSDRWQLEDFISQDRVFYLPNEMLRKVDLMTMAYSVEGRSPFVSPEIISHAAKLKYAHLVRGDTLKWALRQAFADILPPEIIRRPKHGFNVPIDHWLKNEWSFMVEEAFCRDSALYKHGFIHKDSAAIAREMLSDKVRLNGHTVFTFIMLNRWLKDYS